MYRRLLLPVVLVSTLSLSVAAPPAWWAERGATNANPTNDDAVVNLGQLKHFTARAVDELNDAVAGGAGTELDGLVQTWIASHPDAKDHEAINVGQLKWIASKVHARLVYLHWEEEPPAWLQPSPDDHQLTNLGQLKTVFNFDPDADLDGDGLSAAFESAAGTHATNSDTDNDGIPDGEEDADDDGSTNREEQVAGTKPNSDQQHPPQLITLSRQSSHWFDSPVGARWIRGGTNWGGPEWDEPAPAALSSIALSQDVASRAPFPNQPPAEAIKSSLGAASILYQYSDYSTYANSSTSNANGHALHGRYWIKVSPQDVANGRLSFRFFQLLERYYTQLDQYGVPIGGYQILDNSASTVVFTIDPLTGLSNPIDVLPIVGEPDGDSYTFSSLMLVPVIVEQQGFTWTKGVRFCRWLDGFASGGSFVPNFADFDRDRFRIKIPAVIPSLTKLKIKTSGFNQAVINSAIVAKNADGDYEVDVVEENGSMVSKSILLVGDGDDDKIHNGENIINDNDKNDQTLFADFNSLITVTFSEFNNATANFHAQEAVGKIILNARYMSPTGTLPPEKALTILLHVEKMKEIYRQIGIRVDFADLEGESIPQSWLDPVFGNYPYSQAEDYLNKVECRLLNTQLRNRSVPNKHIRIGYVDALLNPEDKLFGGARGWTFQGDDGITVSLHPADAPILGVTAHEVGHTLGLEHLVNKKYLLMLQEEMDWTNNHLDSKRFQEENFSTMSQRTRFYERLD